MTASEKPGIRGQIHNNAVTLQVAWKPLVTFEIMCKIAAVAVFTPISAWTLSAILAWSGSDAVSNYDLAAFFLSFKGVLLIALTATLTFAVLFFEIGGVIMISLAAMNGRNLSAYQLIKFLGVSFPRLWRLALRQFLLMAAAAAPFALVAVGAAALFLSESDVNYYLQTKPPEFWWAAGIAGIAGLGLATVLLVLQVRWVFSVPALMLEKRSPSEALKESRRLAEVQFRTIVWSLLCWGLWLGFLTVAAVGLQWVIEFVLMGIAGDSVPLMLAMTGLLLAIDLVIAVVVTFLWTIPLGVLLARLFKESCDHSGIPDHLFKDENTGQKNAPSAILLIGIAATAMLVIAGVTATNIADSIDFDDSVTITAHRGSSVKAPENTFSAIKLAIEEGADVCEIDVFEAGDGTIVVIHDKDLKRVTGVTGNVWETSYEELKTMDFGKWFSEEFEGERIPTLAEVIEMARGKIKLNIELKYHGHEKEFEKEVVRLIRDADFVDECFFTSLNYEGLKRAKEIGGNIRAGLIVTANVGDVAKLDVDLLSVNASSVSRDFIARARGAGKEVHVWTVNHPANMNTMIHLGVDSIITDVPDLASELIAERSEMTDAERAFLVIHDFLKGRL